MKAGAALGLLAGLGALNAIRGGREGTGKRFTGLIDMLDGGGAGASGDRFEGGGLLSILGNLFAKPLEAQDNVERIAADTNATKAVTEALKQAITPEQRSSAAMTEMNRQRGLLADQFDQRDMQGATDFRQPATTKELTGSADMPPELLPMTTLRPSDGGNDAYSQLFGRSVEQGYLGADMPSYVAEKRLINMAAHPNSEYTDLDEAGYVSLMPPSLMRQAAGTPTAPYEQTGAVTEVRFGPRGEPTSLLDTRQQSPSPDEARALRAIAENNMMDQYINLPPYQQRAMIETMLQRGY